MNYVYPKNKFEFEDHKKPQYFDLKVGEKKGGSFGVCHDETGKRTWYNGSIQYSDTLNIYEVIKKCIFFADLENHNGMAKSEFLQLLEDIKVDFPVFFRKFWKLEQDIHFYFFATFSTAEYPSSHLYIDAQYSSLGEDGLVRKSFATINPFYQKNFWKKFTIAYPKYKSIIDLLVYTTERQLRLIYSPSFKKESYGSYHIPCSNVFENLPLKEGFITMPPLPCFFRASCANIKYTHLEFLTDTEQFKTGKKFITHYERIVMEYLLKCKKNIDRRKDWESAAKRIYTFYKLLGEDPLPHFLKYCANNGWKQEAHIKENIELFAKYDKCNLRSIKTLNNNETFFNPLPECTDKYVNYKKDGKRITLIKAPTKTGKTINFCGTFTEKVLVIVPLRSLGDEYVKKYGFADYRNCNWNDKFVDKETKEFKFPNKIVICVNSLAKMEDYLQHIDVVMFDEITSICDRMGFVQENSWAKKFGHIEASLKIILTEKKVFMVSANLSTETFLFLDSFDQKDYDIVHYTRKTYYKRTAVIFKKESQYYQKIKELTEEGKKLVIPTNSVVVANTIESMLKGKTLKIIADQNSEGKDTTIDTREWGNYDNIIYTPRIESGVSYDDKDKRFDVICPFFIARSNNYTSAHQQIFRIRKPTDKTMYMFAECNKYLKSEDSYTIESVLAKKKLGKSKEKKINEENTEKKLEFDFSDKDVRFKNRKYYSSLTQVVHNAEFKNRYSQTEYRNLIVADLVAVGFKIEYVETDEKQKKPTKEAHNNAVLNNKSVFSETHRKMSEMYLENMEKDPKKDVRDVVDCLYEGFNYALGKKTTNAHKFLYNFEKNFDGTMDSIDKFMEKYIILVDTLLEIPINDRITKEKFLQSRPCDKAKRINTRLKKLGYLLVKPSRNSKYRIEMSLELQKILENYKNKSILPN